MTDIDAKYDAPDIFAVIIREMSTDDDRHKENANFQWFYDRSDEATKEIIDLTMIHLCGWSVPTLITMAKGAED